MQGQITSNKDAIAANAKAIAELTNKVNQGVFVKSVTKDGNGLLITMSDGTTSTIANVVNEEVKPGSVVTIDKETGKISIDGVETEFFAVKDTKTGDVKVPYINEEGELITFDAEGNEVKTGIKKNETVAVENADGSYTLSIPGADGKLISIKLPSPASAINTMVIEGLTAGKVELKLTAYTFKMDAPSVTTNREGWKGAKKDALPKDGTQIYAGDNSLTVRVEPASVDATELNFALVDSKSQKVNNATFTVKEAGVASIARTSNNSRYTVNFNQVEIPALGKDQFLNQFEASSTKAKLFALEANETFRTDYVTVVTPADYASPATTDLLTPYKLNGVEASAKGTTLASSPTIIALDLNKEYKITYGAENVNAPHLYDVEFTYDVERAKLFGAVINQENGSVKLTKNPDPLTEAVLEIKVRFLDVKGYITEKVFFVSNSSKIVAPSTYEAVEHEVKADNGAAATSANFFSIDLAAMKSALGTNLSLWSTKVNLDLTSYEFYTAEACAAKDKLKNKVTSDAISSINAVDILGVAPVTLSAAAKEGAQADEIVTGNNGASAKFIKFPVDNSVADGFLTLGKKYFVKVTFKSESTKVLNTIVVPVTFTAPTLSEQFVPAPGYVKDGVINAYFDQVNGTINGVTKAPYTKLGKYFDKYSKVAKDEISVIIHPEEEIEAGELMSNYVITANAASQSYTFDNTWIGFNTNFDASKNETPKAYGKVFTVVVKQDKYNEWTYNPLNGDALYVFKMRLASAIYDGTIVPAEGTSITLKANDLINGAIVKASDILGKDYAGNVYNVVPDKYADNGKTGADYQAVAAWANPQIANVEIAKGQYMTGAVVVPVTKDAEGKEVAGGFKLTAEAISSDCTSTLTVKVTDKWGYVLTKEVTINIKK